MSTLLKLISGELPSIKDCTRCILHKQRTNPVLGEGNINADIVFLGEAPGQQEDEEGRPFVGRSGQLLNVMIDKMGLKREDVYILNVCKCRPPDNRKPLPEEMEACKVYLHAQLKEIQPIVVIALGATATEALLGEGEGTTKRRGKVYDYTIDNLTLKVIPTFHPSFLLRNGTVNGTSAKVLAAEDLSLAKKMI